MEFCKLLTKEDNLYQYITYLKNANKLNLIIENEVIYFATLYKEWSGTKLLGIFTIYEDMEKEFKLNEYDYASYEEYDNYNRRVKSNYSFEEYNKYEKVYTKNLILYGIPSVYERFSEDINFLKKFNQQAEERKRFYRRQYNEIYNDALNDILLEIQINYSKLKDKLLKKD